MRVYRTSVRSLVEFILRSGSIESGMAGGIKAQQRALEGTRLHQKLERKSMGEFASYQKEVTFLRRFAVREPDGTTAAVLELEGRADGIYSENGLLTVDEIKSTDLPPETIDENSYPLHWAQAEGYAYLFLLEQQEPAQNNEPPVPEPLMTLDTSRVRIRLTYVQTESEKIRYLYRTFSSQEIRTFFEDLLARYFRWLLFHAHWCEKRDASLRELDFPYPEYREGQRTMAAYVYKTISAENTIYLEAPTGIGKTLSVLFPSLKAMGEGKLEKIFYLTAKNMTAEAAEHAVTLLEEKSGLKLKTVHITARDRICFLEKRDCRPEVCPYANGHFNRVNQAVLESLSEFSFFDADTVSTLADRYEVCPYEFSLDLSDWADLIICDYNYAFDPTVSLKRFFADSRMKAVLLVDEAHNLVDRARSMYTAELTRSELMQARRLLARDCQLYKGLSRLSDLFQEAGRNIRETAKEQGVSEEPEEGYLQPLEEMDQTLRKKMKAQLEKVIDLFGEHMEHLRRHPEETTPETALSDESMEKLWDLYFDLLFFLRMEGRLDKGFFNYALKKGSDLTLRLFCVDPSGQLSLVYEHVCSVVFFSATLDPIWYYKRLLGGTGQISAVCLPSPFERENRAILIEPLAMNYRSRSRNVPQLCEMIHTMYASRKGHYMVYFPSFSFLEQTRQVYEEAYPEDAVLYQSSGMGEEERQNFIEAFRTGTEALLGMCVLGGVFAEGIDLTGESLIGAMVVSCGLPQLGLERDLIRSHLDQMEDEAVHGRGFEYAYTYPGFSRVLQAAGRVIRTENDRGVILLVDERFATSRYRALFPEEWSDAKVLSKEELKEALEEFWQTGDQEE